MGRDFSSYPQKPFTYGPRWAFNVGMSNTPVLRGKRALAEYLGIGETSAARLLREDVVPSFSQGQRARSGLVRYVLKSDADQYLARLREAALQDARR